MTNRIPGWCLALILLVTAATAATAAPERYRLDAARSVVGFSIAVQGKTTWGRMPVRSADLLLDLDNLPNSRIEVTLDARGARIGSFLLTEALHGPSLLNSRAWPDIFFRATRIRGSLRAATVEGELTVRGVTRPVRLDAALYRQPGTALTDRSKLVVLLTGAINRHDFGVSGFPEMAGDRVDLRIIAVIERSAGGN